VAGDLFEIGVYCGKTAILLGYLQQPNESLVVCDLFESDEVPEADRAEVAHWYGGLSRNRFEAIYSQYHAELPQIFQMPSNQLWDKDLGAHFRLIHIDGSHVFDTVKGDIALAKSLSNPHAIVAFDDYGSPHCPGIPAAVWQAHFELGLEPFLLTKTKLYAHWGGYDGEFLDELEIWTRSSGLVSERHWVHGRELLRIVEDPDGWTPRKVVDLSTPPGLREAVLRVRRSVTLRRVMRRVPQRPMGGSAT
jgi:hypothetical protein